MKNFTFLKLSNSFFLIFSICSFFLTNTVDAQGINCNKICYEYGTSSTGGSICTGAPGAVPANVQVIITDRRGNRATVRSQADGSFGVSTANLVASVGATVVISVNRMPPCRVKVKPPGSCRNQAGGNQGGGNNQGNVPNQGGGANQGGGGNAANPCNPQKIGQIEGLQSEIAQMRMEAVQMICKGNIQEGSQALGQAQQLDQQLDQQLVELLNGLVRAAGQGGGNVNPGNGNGNGNGNGGGAVNCAKIRYIWGPDSSGGSACGGQKGAVPANSQVVVMDAAGNTQTTTSDKDGGFRVACNNLTARPGDFVTVSVNGQNCRVRVQR